MTDPRKIHKEAIVIDNTCPLAVLDNYHDNYRRGGVTVIAATVGYGVPGIGNLDFTMKTLGKWHSWFRSDDTNLLHVTRAEDILEAKELKKLGIIFHFQGTTPFEDDIHTVALYHQLGLRMCQLCYNEKDLVGCGCAIENDTGLTEFGGDVIVEMNRLGIVVDCGHTGYKTTMDAIAASSSPVVISHGNAKAVCDNRRNVGDDLIRAVAENGGVIGFNGFPGFVADKDRPTLDDLLDHVDHLAEIAGPENICVGIDYFEYQAGVADDETAGQVYGFLLESGAWTRGEYPAPPWYYPEEIEMPEKMENLTIGLHRRGYSEDEIKGILGLNMMRVFKAVWK
ncbi:MAG: dipeptidase [Desulfobacula sp.]|nr:dipeptidase [Desulfobacula sp.]